MATTPAGGARALTDGERVFARSIYHDAIVLDRVEIRRRRWWPLQPRSIVMAPMGNIHFHARSPVWSEDFAHESLALQGLLIHELCHVWQHQRGVCLPLARHPFCRYGYTLMPGRPLQRYGIEQQAEIVRHAFLLRQSENEDGAADLARYLEILPFDVSLSSLR